MTLRRDGPPTEARPITTLPSRQLHVDELERLSSATSLSCFPLATCSPTRVCCLSLVTDGGCYVCGFDPDDEEWRELVAMPFGDPEDDEPSTDDPADDPADDPEPDESEEVLEELLDHVEQSLEEAYDGRDCELALLTDAFATILRRTVLEES
ncbi:hypothetical protein ACFOZ7_00900 [Natribaculum luteum]|uniref:DUF7964 domain-containing protein n=1 Tax=Natribaculum luteum TaxID=1586232 RepID=A0ABD5NU06_9EURY|nr:hypothetical protein [Natribaculum luteum]